MDAVWALVLSRSSALADPYEYREMMKVAFGWSEKTMEQVSREFSDRKDEKRPAKKAKSAAASSPSAGPKPSEMDKLQALMANAKPRERRQSV